tara:strand:+ start:4746 stop:6989 length:2244 start_codon:yes stop_codon:yes gene_type:complete
MFKFRFLFVATYIHLFLISGLFAENISKIVVTGNERISKESIIMFSGVELGQNIQPENTNDIIKNLYETNFFKNIIVNFDNNLLKIDVLENSIIQTINYNGIKANKILDAIQENLNLKARSSYNEILLKNDKQSILSSLRTLGYYFSTIDVYVEELGDNKVNLNFNIELGKKAKITKISFIGSKIFKNKKLHSLIISEEYKFWKFLSGKKFLNQDLISLDKRLLKNFYLNKGYYNVIINSSFAKLINNDEFELVFNIDAKNKTYFGDVSLIIPNDYNFTNFEKLKDSMDEIKGSSYSLRTIEVILDQIDEIIINEQFESIKATVKENLVADKINLVFTISDSEKLFIEKINIYGNNITQENVIRNQLLIDEGDPYNEILETKSINNIKNLNFFKTVSKKVTSGNEPGSKIINITVQEKPTGEIMAGAGVGTSGGTISLGIKENNFLGKGIGLDTNLTINKESLKGQFIIENGNFRNSDKSLYFSALAIETDRLKASGYKNKKAGFSFGTKFEYYDDFFIGLRSSNFYERIETDATASIRQKAQEGDYWDSFLDLDFDIDKRNQRHQTTKGFISSYKTNLPIISDTHTLTNSYSYKYFTELYENNVTALSFLVKSSFSLSNKDIKLSERLELPSSSLRGFERAKVGPKDGTDYIGGNYVSSINFSSTLPSLLENYQNADFLMFLDIANIWGVDYDNTLNKGDDIKSAIGIGVDWFTPIGPLNFSIAQPITKSSSDIIENFRFNLGTTF